MDKPAITQAMIDAYDEYTHLTLDRRGFMEKLTKLAGTGAAAAVIAPMLAASSAQAAIVAEDDARVKGEDITWPGAGGEMKGYLARPAGETGKLPAVIVIHENRGLNPHTRDVARRMALEGFLALAPDYLSPSGGTPADEDQAREMIGKLDPAQTIANGVATVAFLAAHEGGNGKVGAVGFCWGGGAVNDLAVNAPDLRRRRRLLRAAGKDRGCGEDHGAAAAALCGAGRAHQCRHRGLQGRADGSRQGIHRSRSMTGRSTPSTTTRPKRATTRRRPTWRGGGPWRSSRRSWREIQVRPVCKWRFSALRCSRTQMYAPPRCSKLTIRRTRA